MVKRNLATPYWDKVLPGLMDGHTFTLFWVDNIIVASRSTTVISNVKKALGQLSIWKTENYTSSKKPVHLRSLLAHFPQTCSIMRADEKFLAIIPCMLGLLPENLMDLPF